MMKGVCPLRLTLQKQHPQTHASASVSTTPSAKLRLSGARRSCPLQVKDHLQASWISRAGAAAARFPAGGPPRLYERASGAKKRLAAEPRARRAPLTKIFRSRQDHNTPYHRQRHPRAAALLRTAAVIAARPLPPEAPRSWRRWGVHLASCRCQQAHGARIKATSWHRAHASRLRVNMATSWTALPS